MNDQLHDRVTEVLNEADAQSGSMLGSDDDSSGRELREAAEEASELVESTEPRALLEAVGLGTLPDGTEPETLPEAIAKGDPERVEDLQRLLKLAKFADRSDDEGLEVAVDGLRETIDDRAADENGDGESGADEAAADAADADDAEQESTAESTDDGEDEGGLEDRLRSAMSSSLGEFGDDVGGIRDRLEEASSSLTDDEGDDETADSSEDADAEAEDAEDEDEEEGPLGLGGGDDGLLGSEEQRGGGSRGASHHSTMAPSPTKRADMRTPRRFSTMPDKN